MATRTATEMIVGAGGKAKDLFPVRESEEEVRAWLSSLPPEHRGLALEMGRRMSNVVCRSAAAVMAGLVVQQALMPNASFGMWPQGLGRGANAVPGTIYPLIPFINGVAQTNGVQFTEGQRFFGLKTGNLDTANGWCFAGGTVKLASDAISGIESDVSFMGWSPALVKGRITTGEYESFEIVSQTEIQFTASAFIPPGMPQAPMVEGVIVDFWDDRCKKQFKGFDRSWANSFDEIHSALVEELDSNGNVSIRTLRKYLPTRRG